MGIIAESMADYAQPLIDESDGSAEEVQKALAIAMLCWNLSLSPKEERDQSIEKTRLDMKMKEREFQEFRTLVLEPMIRRHEEMFPRMHRDQVPFALDDLLPGGRGDTPIGLPFRPLKKAPAGKYPGTGRNRPCPCGSGKKYKLCCGA